MKKFRFLLKYLLACAPFVLYLIIREAVRIFGPEGAGMVAQDTTVLNLARIFLMSYWAALVLSCMMLTIMLVYDVSEVIRRWDEKRTMKKISEE